MRFCLVCHSESEHDWWDRFEAVDLEAAKERARRSTIFQSNPSSCILIVVSEEHDLLNEADTARVQQQAPTALTDRARVQEELDRREATLKALSSGREPNT